MTRQNRATLKDFFKDGARPSADQFADLIDSALIMSDEGFLKAPDRGLQVTTIGGLNGLMSFQRQTSLTPEWSLGLLNGEANQLALQRGALKDEGVSVLTIDQGVGDAGDAAAKIGIQADVGIGVAVPGHALDVNGVVSADGRLGRQWREALPADGLPHPITDTLSGCVAFEVMAGVGGAIGNGRFALLHAIAMNTYNPAWWDDLLFSKKRIRQHHAYYSRSSDRLQLKWIPVPSKDPNKQHGADARFTLSIRTRSRYDDPGAKIIAYVTRLWVDPAISTPPAGQGGPPR